MDGLVMMTCTKLNVRLSTRGCARAWEKAQDEQPEAWQSGAACRFCSIGAKNAGKAVAPMAEVTAALRKTCSRCHATGRRLIGSKFCICCYNRDREAQMGANARGTRPAICDQLHARSLAVTHGERTDVRTAARVLHMAEAIVSTAKGATAPMAFGAAPLGPVIAQWQAALERGEPAPVAA